MDELYRLSSIVCSFFLFFLNVPVENNWAIKEILLFYLTCMVSESLNFKAHTSSTILITKQNKLCKVMKQAIQ